MTNWYKPCERLPQHEEQVLIRKEDHIEVSFYNAATETFNLRDGSVFSKTDDIAWMQMLREEKNY